jgi:hypothetical protein
MVVGQGAVRREDDEVGLHQLTCSQHRARDGTFGRQRLGADTLRHTREAVAEFGFHDGQAIARVISVPHPADARDGAERMLVVMQHQPRPEGAAQLRRQIDLPGCGR